jgi:O-antigen ligase
VTTLLIGTSLWAASRGGIGGLAAGIVLTVALAIYTRRSSRSPRGETVILGACLIGAAVTVAVGASEATRDELATMRDFSKLALARDALRLVPSFPTFGVGRGAFETVYPFVREGKQYVTFTHPENIIAQWTVEWGLPVAIVGLCLVAWALRPSIFLRAMMPRAGAWVALIVVVLSDLVDFHLEVPGVVVVTITCAAIVLGAQTTTSRELDQSQDSRFPC